MIKLQQLLFEEPESGPDAIFGKYLFDAPRDDIPETEKEDMSPLELDMLQTINTYVTVNSPKGLGKRAQTLLNLVQKGLYAPILDPGTQPVYRLLRFTGSDAKKEVAEVLGGGLSKIGKVGAGILQPTKDGIQGWSSELDYMKGALNFKQTNREDCLVLFKADPTINKFFGKPGKLADVSTGGDESFNTEMETISYSPVNYIEARYVFPAYVYDFSLPNDERVRLAETRKMEARQFMTFETNEVPAW